MPKRFWGIWRKKKGWFVWPKGKKGVISCIDGWQKCPEAIYLGDIGCDNGHNIADASHNSTELNRPVKCRGYI